MTSPTDLERQLRASIFAEQLTQLVLFAVLSLKAELHGQEQHPIGVSCLREWSAGAAFFLRESGFPASDRALLKPHVRRALAAWVDRGEEIVGHPLFEQFANVVRAEFGSPSEGESR